MEVPEIHRQIDFEGRIFDCDLQGSRFALAPMAVIKVACPKCGQKVSGDDSFFGTSVECPICTSQIAFPANPNLPRPEPPLPQVDDDAADRMPEPVPSAPPEYASSDYPPQGHGNVDVPQRPPSNDQPNPGQPPQFEEEPVPLSNSQQQQQQHQASSGSSNDDGDVPSPALGATSLVLGILGFITCFGAILMGPAAIICGHIALSKAKHSPVQPAPGRMLALIGTILGYVSLVLLIVTLVLMPVIKGMIEAAAQNGAA